MLTLYLGIERVRPMLCNGNTLILKTKQSVLNMPWINTQKEIYKGRKDTIIQVPEIVMTLLQEWKSVQAEQLLKLKIKQTPDQYLLVTPNLLVK